MSKKNIVIYFILILLVIIASLWYGFNTTFQRTVSPLDITPNDVAILIEIDNPSKVYSILNGDNPFWKKLSKAPSIEKFNNNYNYIHNLFVEEDNNMFFDGPMSIAIFSDTINFLDIAILSPNNGNISLTALKKLLKSKLERDYGILDFDGNIDGFKIVDADAELTQYIALLHGVLVYSTSKRLIVKLHNTYNTKNVLSSDTIFTNLRKTSGSKAHARLFINYSSITELISPIIAVDRRIDFNWLNNFASWSEMDLQIKSSEILLSGFTSSESNKYISSISNSKPLKMGVINLLPFNTNQMLWIGVSDFEDYYQKISTNVTSEKLSSRVNNNIGGLLEVLSGEFAFATNSASLSQVMNNSWVVAGVRDKENANKIFKLIDVSTGNNKESQYNGYKIRQIKDEKFISGLFGKAFSTIKSNYYTFITDYIIFANSESSLINLINFVETGKTLDLNDNYKDFSDNISTNSNLLLYFKPKDILKRISSYLNKTTSQLFESENEILSSIQGVSIQMTSGKPYVFTNSYLKHSDVYHEENLATWKVNVNDEILNGPFLVNDHQTNSKNIIIFDRNHILYFIDAQGNILWEKKIDNGPISNIYEVDFYKNRKIQYLFNTNDFIYLLDKKGRDVKGYPKRLHTKATNGIVVFDYLKKKDYRVVVAQSDKKVYNYSITGKEIKGWKLPRMQSTVNKPIERLMVTNKDYIIITDIDNQIKIVDRKGKRRIKLKGTLNKAKNSDFYVNKTNSKGIIITTNVDGKLIYISSSGNINTTDFGKFSPNHFFLYEDFDGDGSKDFIYIDEGKLKVFDRFKKELFSYDFDSDIYIRPMFFELDAKQQVLGVVDDDEKTIYLFDKKGNIIISKGLVGERQFIIGKLSDNNKINLVSASGNTLYNYRIK
jgi:hypothetical protein